MSQAFRHWLPANAAAPALAQGAVADLADAWSREWFADEPVRALGSFARIAEARGELRKTQWHVCEGGLAIGLPLQGLAALGAQVLAVAARSGDRQPADLALLKQVGGDCLDDLKRRAAALFQLPKTAVWTLADAPARAGEVHRIDIASPSRSAALVLELSAELFARFVRARLPQPPAPAPFGAPAEALAGLPVSLSAMLGSCAITVAELSTLGPGDVLVLDRALDAKVPLAVNGRPAARGACTVTDRGGAAAIKIVQSPAG